MVQHAFWIALQASMRGRGATVEGASCVTVSGLAFLAVGVLHSEPAPTALESHSRFPLAPLAAAALVVTQPRQHTGTSFSPSLGHSPTQPWIAPANEPHSPGFHCQGALLDASVSQPLWRHKTTCTTLLATTPLVGRHAGFPIHLSAQPNLSTCTACSCPANILQAASSSNTFYGGVGACGNASGQGRLGQGLPLWTQSWPCQN